MTTYTIYYGCLNTAIPPRTYTEKELIEKVNTMIIRQKLKKELVTNVQEAYDMFLDIKHHKYGIYEN